MSEEETAAGFQREGERTIEAETTEEETSADSRSEDENQGEDTRSSQGENDETQDNTPFHKNPRWKERETEWDQRFNDQERRHHDDLKAIRDEFSNARKDNAESSTIPPWFGGDQAQWNAYRADRDAELKVAEDRAYERLNKDRSTEEKATEDATKFMQSEITAIQADPELNPGGEKIDASKLFKVVYDNQLIDTQGRWNYRAGMKILKASSTAAANAPERKARKEVGASTGSESRGETETKTVTTSQDFKTDRPW